MVFLTPRLRVTLGLVGIAVSGLLLALAGQLVPDYHASRLEVRKSYCEHLALHCSLAVQKEDVQTLKEIIQASVRRQPDFMSARLRRGGLEVSPGDLLLEVGTHRAQGNLENSDFIEVPIHQAERRWGTLELRFRPVQPPGLWGLLQHPVVAFSLFFSGVCGMGFFLFIRSFFRQIDSSQDQQVQNRALSRLQRDDPDSVVSVKATPIPADEDSVRFALASFDDLAPLEEKNSHLQRLLLKVQRSRDAIQRQNLHLHDLATKDPLTACLNRRAFFGEFETHWAGVESATQPLCCIMVDIDHFKAINDNHGHSVGDQVLQEISLALRERIRKTDLLCRYGGEEFCILMPGTDLPEASQLAERLRKEIEARRPMDLPVSASFGVSAGSQGAKNIQELLDQADKALYRSKRAGRNRVMCWEPGDVDLVLENGRADATAPLPQTTIPFQAVNVLLTTLAYRHPATADHCRRVSNLCVVVGNGVLSSNESYVLEMAALLHDVGKLGVPDAILLKPGALTAEEWRALKAHESISEDLVAAAFSCSELTDIIRSHHYGFEGNPNKNGAPKGQEISVGARLLAIADAYDSMVSDQVYRQRRSQQEAFQELRAHAGKQFDPDLVELFLKRVAEREESPELRVQSGEPKG